MKPNERLKEILAEWYIYVILILFWLVSCAISPFFRTRSTFSTILITAVPIALIGLGQTFVVLSAGFDLSVGTIASLTTAIASVIMVWGIIPAISLILLLAILIGLANGIGVSKFKLDTFIMTLGMMFFLSGVAFYIRPSPGGTIPDSFRDKMLFQIGDFPLVPSFILISTLLLGELILNKRKFGRETYAIGGDPESAKLLGINVDLTRIKVFIFSALTAAAAGLFLSARYGSGNASIGDSYLFDSFTAVFMGGTLVTGGVGGYKGTFGAALIMASIGHILNFLGVTIWYHFIIKGLLLAGVAGIQQLIMRRR